MEEEEEEEAAAQPSGGPLDTSSKTVWTHVELQMGADEDGPPEERAAFIDHLQDFHRQHSLDFKPLKFYGEPLNCLKLWRAVIKLGGYDVVTTAKLWRQSLLEYEKHKTQSGELQLHASPPYQSTTIEKEASGYRAPGSGRARRDAAAHAMQGWHGTAHGEKLHPAPRREKPLKSIGLHEPRTRKENSEKLLHADANEELRMSPVLDWLITSSPGTSLCAIMKVN